MSESDPMQASTSARSLAAADGCWKSRKSRPVRKFEVVYEPAITRFLTWSTTSPVPNPLSPFPFSSSNKCTRVSLSPLASPYPCCSLLWASFWTWAVRTASISLFRLTKYLSFFRIPIFSSLSPNTTRRGSRDASTALSESSRILPTTEAPLML